MLRFKGNPWRFLFVAMLMALIGCQQHTLVVDDPGYYYMSPNQNEEYGTGGYGPWLTLPFRSGEYWLVTQAYNTGSHVDYGFSYGNDSYALDFSQSGCDAYGEPVTPVLLGTVMRVGREGSPEDDGYGNNILIESEDGYVARYAHLSEIFVEEGDYVTESDIIGQVGNTGYVTGTACGDYPGTHLHLAFYHDGDRNAIPPQPLSGTETKVGCWYNREGLEDCQHDPGDYTPQDDIDESNQDHSDNSNDDGDGGDNAEDYDDEDGVIENDSDGLNVAFLEISPEQGVREETEYVWVATVVGDGGEPEVTLSIVNPNDGVTYEFPMSTDNRGSPWVFTYQKTLRDASTYEYWVTAEDDGRRDESSQHRVGVDEGNGNVTNFLTTGYWDYGDRTVEWFVGMNSNDAPNVELKIVNPSDAAIYSFAMDVDGEGGDHWFATYEKTLRDSTVYTYWFEATNRDGTQNSSVFSLEAE